MQGETFADLVARLDEGHRESWEERAAIREFDGLLPRADAEALALLDVLRRNPAALLGVTVVSVEVEGEERCALVTDRGAVRLRLTCRADRSTDLAALVAERFGGAALLSAMP